MQTSFHHYKQHGFIRSEKKVLLLYIYIYHWWHHWLCDEWHLLPNGMAHNCKIKRNQKYITNQAYNIISNNNSHNNMCIMVSYTMSLSKSFKTFVEKWESKSTLREVTPSEASRWPLRTKIISHQNIIYRYKGYRLQCDKKYIGESVRTFRTRLKEHFNTPSPIHDHVNTTGHHTMKYLLIVGRGSHNIARTIKEAIYQGQWSIPKQEHLEVSVILHMGWGPVQTSYLQLK